MVTSFTVYSEKRKTSPAIYYNVCINSNQVFKQFNTHFTNCVYVFCSVPKRTVPCIFPGKSPPAELHHIPIGEISSVYIQSRPDCRMDLISPEQPKLLQILKAPQASRISNGILFYTGQELHELPVCPVPLPLHVDPVDQELIGITRPSFCRRDLGPDDCGRRHVQASLDFPSRSFHPGTHRTSRSHGSLRRQ